MSIQSNFPAIKPTLLLDFANTKQLDPRITFTRASTATYYGTQTAKAEENLILQSQTFGSSSWSIEGITRTADTSTAPDGTTTADTVTETATTSAHRLDADVATSSTVTLSVFAKLGVGTRFLTIGVSRDLTHCGSATFDLSLVTNTQTQVNGGIYASPSATITAVAQGFYRCTFTVTTDTVNLVRIGLNNTGTPTSGNRAFGASYTGDNTSSLILWGAQLEQRSAVTAYTPTTTQTITNYIPQLLTAASGVARFDHNPTTFESLGLEIEEQRTNLLTYSQQFDDAAWTKTNSSITANTVIAPDGALTGDKIVSTSGSLGFIAQSVSQTSGTSYALSVLAKAGEYSFCQLRINTSVSSITRAYFNLSNGTLTGVTNCTASITPVGNGWYRCSIVYTATVTTAGGGQRIYGQVDASDTVGDGYSGIYIWGAQLEAGAFATSYIQTVASQVTRSADAASMTGTNFSSWYSQGQGTLYAEFNPLALAASSGVVINDNTTSNRIRLATTSVSDQGTVTTSGTAQAVLDGGTPAANTSMKLAMTYQVNNFALSLNGATAATDTNGTVPVVSQLQIGSETTTVGNLTIKKMAYYPIVSTATQLQALTS